MLPVHLVGSAHLVASAFCQAYSPDDAKTIRPDESHRSAKCTFDNILSPIPSSPPFLHAALYCTPGPGDSLPSLGSVAGGTSCLMLTGDRKSRIIS